MSHSRRRASPVFVKYKLGVLGRKVNQNRVLRQFMAKKNTAEAVFFLPQGVLSETADVQATAGHDLSGT
jgi:hypothetical protein